MIFFSYISFSRFAFFEFSACSNFASFTSFFSNFTSSLNLLIRDSLTLSFFQLLCFSFIPFLAIQHKKIFSLWAGYELFEKLFTWNCRARPEQICKLCYYLNWKAFLLNNFLLLIVEFITDIITKKQLDLTNCLCEKYSLSTYISWKSITYAKQ